MLKSNPGILPMLCMTSAPPLARDRLVGLAYASKNLISSMEGSEKKTPRIPPQIEEDSLNEQLTRIIDVLSEVADRDLFPWLEDDTIKPTPLVLERNSISRVEAEFTVGNYQSPKLTESIDVGAIPPLSKWNFIKSGNTQIDSSIVLSDLFHITRGIATGNNAFFILDEDAVLQNSIERDCLIPLLPSPRYLKVPVVESDSNGEPVIEKKRFLLSISCMPDETKRKYPFAWKYLEKGVKEGVDQGYLC